MKLDEVLRLIKQYGQAHLKDDVLVYLLEQRKISTQSIEQWELGYFPFAWEHPFSEIEMRWLEYYKLGFRTKNGNRCLYEGRILFPVYDIYGTLVAIQSRIFPKHDAKQYFFNNRKYWHNSFDKSRVLHGLHKAKDKIRETGQVFVSEGQFDLIASHEFGIQNAICTSGTAFSASLIALLARYADSIVIAYDNDAGGNKAMEKLKKQSFVDLTIDYVTLPSNDGQKQDLDSYLRANGKDAFLALLTRRSVRDTLVDCLEQL